MDVCVFSMQMIACSTQGTDHHILDWFACAHNRSIDVHLQTRFFISLESIVHACGHSVNTVVRSCQVVVESADQLAWVPSIYLTTNAPDKSSWGHKCEV